MQEMLIVNVIVVDAAWNAKNFTEKQRLAKDMFGPYTSYDTINFVDSSVAYTWISTCVELGLLPKRDDYLTYKEENLLAKETYGKTVKPGYCSIAVGGKVKLAIYKVFQQS